eukprot:TRINITY_DN15787_c0_g1_i1.p1 TRINITY_DN15787_c0_g1~~TRINITY_DN15787_c0_g1_i1.p1  ORF type:complete len:785 (+),score=59.67 TRINITY_DN15787_c0_g1_i1:1870-4224(+)
MNNTREYNMSNQLEEEEAIDLKKIFRELADKWHWIGIGILACLIISFLYILYTPPSYQISARVLVNDDEKSGGLAKQAGSLMDLGGLLGGKNSVDNEAEILKTRFLMEQVAEEMQLNIVYARKSNFIKRELYKAPFKIDFIKGVDSIKKTQIEIQKLPNGKLRILSNNLEKEINWNDKFEIKNVGVLKLTPIKDLNMDNGTFVVTLSSIDERVADLMKMLSVGVSNKLVTIIDLGLTYPLPKKGEDILNTLIRKYIEANLGDKNAIADSTGKFIKQRLQVIASELGDVEGEVKQFKQKNRLADMSEQGKVLIQSSSELSTDLAKAETQVSILNDLEKYLKDENKNKRVFPTSLLPQDMVFSGLMNQYNALLIERDKLLLSVTDSSPLIKNLDGQVAEMRAGIFANIVSTKNTFVITRDRLRKQLDKAEGQITAVPEIEKDYLKLARNQQIKQELYIFMMQKAEETAISKTANISIAKTIDPPKAAVIPISPKKSIIYLAGIMAGLVFPILIIFGLNFLNTSISTKQDITNLTTVPIIGEISHNLSDDNLIVANQARSAISEQFRALRTNLSFYLKNKDEKIILLTSSMSGEGKSFTAINLGNILALAGKKILLMELDLRKPGLSAKLGVSNEVGFSNYTIDSTVKVENIIKSLGINKNMFIVSSGPLPPNPAETLMSERMPLLISELKKQFDYIIMDAPPIGIITDAQLLSDYADVVLYLVRQKVTQKNQISIVDDLYKSKKMKNIGIVVNDIVSKAYGYGYGYGTYGEEKQSQKFSRLKRWFK